LVKSIFNKLAVAFNPKDSLKRSEVGIEYEISVEILVSSDGPILSLINDNPNPTFEFPIGVFNDAVEVTGAQSNPTH